MRMNSSIQSLCHLTKTPILFPTRKLSNIWRHFSSQSNKLQSSTRVSAKLDQLDEVRAVDMVKVNVLKQKVELLRIIYDSSVPGRYYNFSRLKVFADDRAEDDGTKRTFKSTRQLTEEALGLIPPRDELIIAFTYRQNGLLVGCKYRTVETRFWLEKDTEKVLYGLGDIIDADEIIIVEGELDKLSVEEAGFPNCVSVPVGAPGKVSDKLPSFEKDTAFQYLWNCKEYLGKAPRIILATDGDPPGHALAEELARRLGKERCWKASWPKKDDYTNFKDASKKTDGGLENPLLNVRETLQDFALVCLYGMFGIPLEVLRCTGLKALKNKFANAEVYHQSMADQQIKDI